MPSQRELRKKARHIAAQLALQAAEEREQHQKNSDDQKISTALQRLEDDTTPKNNKLDELVLRTAEWRWGTENDEAAAEGAAEATKCKRTLSLRARILLARTFTAAEWKLFESRLMQVAVLVRCEELAASRPVKWESYHQSLRKQRPPWARLCLLEILMWEWEEAEEDEAKRENAVVDLINDAILIHRRKLQEQNSKRTPPPSTEPDTKRRKLNPLAPRQTGGQLSSNGNTLPCDPNECDRCEQRRQHERSPEDFNPDLLNDWHGRVRRIVSARQPDKVEEVTAKIERMTPSTQTAMALGNEAMTTRDMKALIIDIWNLWDKTETREVETLTGTKCSIVLGLNHIWIPEADLELYIKLPRELGGTLPKKYPGLPVHCPVY